MSFTPYDFDVPDADIILQATVPISSADIATQSFATEFRVHKLILSAASSVFRDMLAIPPPSKLDQSEIPTVGLSESPIPLQLLLQFIYPIPEPPITDLATLVQVLEPAVKYDVARAISRLRAILVSPAFLSTQALRVYAIASRFGFQEEAKIASANTLSIHIPEAPWYEEYDYMTGTALHLLFSFHRKRCQAAVELVKEEPKPGDKNCWSDNKFYEEFRKRAKTEVTLRPTTTVITSADFMFDIMKYHVHECCRCDHSTCTSKSTSFRAFAVSLGKKIDALPSTI